MADILLTGQLDRLKGISLEEADCVKLLNRMEVKYVFMAARLGDLINLLHSDYNVLEICGKRALPYSTIYFDTPEWLFYHQHIHGKLNRQKIRFRKYEATDESFLEIKEKTNKGRTIKRRIGSRPEDGKLDNAAKDFLNNYSCVAPSSIQPVLYNRFTRITLTNCKIKERITIDFNLTFEDPFGSKKIYLPHLAIAELKKEGISGFSPFSSIAREMKIMPSGFSKYCIGSALVNDSLKRNILKPKFLLLNKFENEYLRSAFTA